MEIEEADADLFSPDRLENYWPKIFRKLFDEKRDGDDIPTDFVPIFSEVFDPKFYSQPPPPFAYTYCTSLDWCDPESQWLIKIYVPKSPNREPELIFFPLVKTKKLDPLPNSYGVIDPLPNSYGVIDTSTMRDIERKKLIEIFTLSDYEKKNICYDQQTKEVWRYKCIREQPSYERCQIRVTISLNAPMVREMILQGKPIAAQDIMLPYLYSQYLDVLNMTLSHLPQHIVNDPLEYAIKCGWMPKPISHKSEFEEILNHATILKKCIKTDLYEYQKNAINWMYNMEKNFCNKKIPFPFIMDLQKIVDRQTLMSQRPDAQGLYASCFYSKFLDKRPEEYIHLKGGMLCDDMGLGKSLMVLALVVLSSDKKKRSKREVIYSDDDIKEDISTLHSSRATLIVCPGQLCKQWKEQYESHFDKSAGLKIIVINTSSKLSNEFISGMMEISSEGKVVIEHFSSSIFRALDAWPLDEIYNDRDIGDIKTLNKRKYDYNALCEADIVIIPINLLTKNVQDSRVFNKDSKISLNKIYWERIVVDEGHEIFMKGKKIDGETGMNSSIVALHSIRSRYRWYVTGTPAPEKMDTLRHAYRFLDINVKSFEPYEQFLFLPKSHKVEMARKFVSTYRDEYLCYNGHIMRGIGMGINRSEHMSAALQKLNTIVEEWLWMRLMWRNTKESVKINTLLPAIQNDIILLDFSPIERKIYDDMVNSHCNVKSLQQLCAHPLVCEEFRRLLYKDVSGSHSKLMDLSQIKDKLIDSYQKDIEETEKQKKEAEELVQKKKGYIDGCYITLGLDPTNLDGITDKETLDLLKDAQSGELSHHIAEFEKISGELSVLESKLILLISKSNYMKTLLPILNGEVDPEKVVCDICSDVIKEVIAFTHCGHYFDPTCITTWLDTTSKCGRCGGIADQSGKCTLGHGIVAPGTCPHCRKSVSKADLMEFQMKPKEKETKEEKKREEKKELSADDFMNPLKEKYGTKMACIIYFITVQIPSIDPTGKVIVFSQFDELLNHIHTTLKENGIDSVICKGNSLVKQKSISRFQGEKDCKVILLSITHCASGTNLTQGNWIFLMDPIIALPDKVRDIEGQAINRAHRQGQKKTVHVIRLIIKDTLEDDILKAASGKTDVFLTTDAEVSSYIKEKMFKRRITSYIPFNSRITSSTHVSTMVSDDEFLSAMIPHELHRVASDSSSSSSSEDDEEKPKVIKKQRLASSSSEDDEEKPKVIKKQRLVRADDHDHDDRKGNEIMDSEDQDDEDKYEFSQDDDDMSLSELGEI